MLGRSCRRLSGVVGIVVCLWVISQEPVASQVPPSNPPAGPEQTIQTIQASREALAKWMETQKIISQEEANWKTAKVALEGRIALLQQEIAEFEGKVAKSDADIKGEDTRKANLETELASAKQAPEELAAAAAYMEGRLKALREALPEVVFKKVQGLYQRIPDDPNNTKVSLAERYQNILGILNEADKANNDIMVTSEVREIAGAAPAEVQTIYVGLAQAYFVNAERNFAGTGRPVNGKWQWTRQDELAGEIGEILGIIQNKGKPHFIHLPVALD